MSEPESRLFVRGLCTEGQWLYCGGPNVADAMSGLFNLLEMPVEDLLHDIGEETIELRVKLMTDEEVEKIPEV